MVPLADFPSPTVSYSPSDDKLRLKSPSMFFQIKTPGGMHEYLVLFSLHRIGYFWERVIRSFHCVHFALVVRANIRSDILSKKFAGPGGSKHYVLVEGLEIMRALLEMILPKR